MNKPLNNYAFIDGQNLNLGIQHMGWNLDFKKFRIYLQEKYKVGIAYYFIGYIGGNSDLYRSLQMAGYILVFKPTLELGDGTVKGNCDAELVLQAMIDVNQYNKAVIVTGDGDFYCLVKHLRKINKFEILLAPDSSRCSHLLNTAAENQINFMNDLRQKLEYKKVSKMKSTP
jgi:uncharacterized LabA/DUF88 family protein